MSSLVSCSFSGAIAVGSPLWPMNSPAFGPRHQTQIPSREAGLKSNQKVVCYFYSIRDVIALVGTSYLEGQHCSLQGSLLDKTTDGSTPLLVSIVPSRKTVSPSTYGGQPRAMVAACIISGFSGSSLTNNSYGGIPCMPLGFSLNNPWLPGAALSIHAKCLHSNPPLKTIF